jgi:hypothetical protein
VDWRICEMTSEDDIDVTLLAARALNREESEALKTRPSRREVAHAAHDARRRRRVAAQSFRQDHGAHLVPQETRIDEPDAARQ